MTRKPDLTDKQLHTIRENLDKFPAEILKLPEFAGSSITRHTVRNYQRRAKGEIVTDEEEDLLARLKQYLNRHGLPSRFHGAGGVTGFITFLETQNHLRADAGDNQETASA
jgi:hypothetical protein